MDRKLVVIAIAGVLLLAGCSGSNGAATETPHGTATATLTSESTDGLATSQAAIEGGHPAVTDGSLYVSGLVRGHFSVLRGIESFTVRNNRTVTYAANGSLSGRSVLLNYADMETSRQRLENRVFRPNGDIQTELIRYGNASATCTLRSGEYECSDRGVSTQQIIGSTMETTSLETIGAPDFAPDGIAKREGQSLYRYSASAFRASMDSNTESELYGADPTLVTATLLVHPDGHIVAYSLTYRTGGEPSQELDLVYTTSAINTTTVQPLDPAQS